VKVAVLSGGVGGAKFAHGLALAGLGGDLSVIVNTGDDFTHMGLHVSPDIDTLLYTLAGLSDRTRGWGRRDESWNFMAAIGSLGGPDWFALGDGDLALHVLRSERLAAGERLSAITAAFAEQWGIAASILPMSDDPVRTICDTDEGRLSFQRYFVARRAEPVMRALRFEGAAAATPAPGVLEALACADAIFIAPSNPFLSVDPILAVPGIADALRTARGRGRPVLAISPLVGGKAMKGPTAKLMDELGLARDNSAIAAHYGGLIDMLVIHEDDAPPSDLAHRATDTLMPTDAARLRVAADMLAFARDLRA
jgi:LPPG:FO 2-phospho-L-lactate transferase